MTNTKYNTIAKAIRVEIDESNDNTYIVFKITDEKFKQKVREHWLDDVEVKIIGKHLILKDD